MKKPTANETIKFAKSCGFEVTKSRNGYTLKTCYNTYHEKYLEEINRKIFKDQQRLINSRF